LMPFLPSFGISNQGRELAILILTGGLKLEDRLEDLTPLQYAFLLWVYKGALKTNG